MPGPHPQARWDGSKPRCRQLRIIALRWLTCQGNGSTGFTNANLPSGSRWIWDSSVSPTHGAQEDTAWNGHFGCMCYHPLFVFNQFGHLERCALRPGNVHSADGWKDVLKSAMARYADRHLMRFFRGDAAFAIPDLYGMLEAESYFYAIRLRTNRVLQGRIAHLLKRPVGRPPNHVRRTCGDFQYQAASWDKPRRVIAKVDMASG